MSDEDNPDERTNKQFYNVIIYDQETGSYYLRDWSDETGREEGSIWDEGIEEWKYPETNTEEQIEAEVWEILGKALLGLPQPPATKKTTKSSGEEQDLIY